MIDTINGAIFLFNLNRNGIIILIKYTDKTDKIILSQISY